jgi:hypothetical protein
MKHSRSSTLGAFLAVLLSATCVAGIPAYGSPHDRVAELEESVAELSAAMDGVLANTLPAGTVMAWWGLPGMLPEGWALCDGLGGTPDLHDKFIMGAALPEDVGEEGGSAEHQHLVQPHRHEFPVPHHVHEIPIIADLLTTEAGDHTHVLGDSAASVFVDTFGLGMTSVAGHPHTHTVDVDGLHDHDLEIPGHFTGVGQGTAQTSYAESSSEDAEHLPPYYKLAFIVKLGEASPEEPPGSSTGNPNQRIEALEDGVAALSLALEEAMPFQVPENLTVMWSGSIDLIPSGWVLCDGTNGTPDLRERFVMGASSGEEVGEQGGNEEHTHEVGAHQHEVAMPPHAHDLPEFIAATEPVGDHTHELSDYVGAEFPSGWPENEEVCRPDHSHTISADGAHSHALTIPARATLEDEGSSYTSLGATTLDPEGNIPPYYKLAFVMKLGGTPPSAKDAPGSSSLGLHDRIAALEEAVAKLTSALNALLTFFVPPEAIAVWAESPDVLPDGWAVCDGENGTPDLRGMFIMGAVVGAGGQGGEESHGHSFEPHDHTAYFPHGHESGPLPVGTSTWRPERTGHTHDASLPTVITNGQLGGFTVAGAHPWHDHFPYFDAATIHEHDLILSDVVAPVGSELHAETTDMTSEVASAEHLPPYYKAAFVMKLVE